MVGVGGGGRDAVGVNGEVVVLSALPCGPLPFGHKIGRLPFHTGSLLPFHTNGLLSVHIGGLLPRSARPTAFCRVSLELQGAGLCMGNPKPSPQPPSPKPGTESPLLPCMLLAYCSWRALLCGWICCSCTPSSLHTTH